MQFSGRYSFEFLISLSIEEESCCTVHPPGGMERWHPRLRCACGGRHAGSCAGSSSSAPPISEQVSPLHTPGVKMLKMLRESLKAVPPHH